MTCATTCATTRQNTGVSWHTVRMLPNADDFRPTPETMRALVARIGKSQSWISRQTGISRRRIVYLLQGKRVNRNAAGEPYTKETVLTYPEQFTLESLADWIERNASEQARIKP